MARAKLSGAVAGDGIDWTGAKTRRGGYEPGTTIFSQGDAATSVMYIEQGTVRLSVLSHAGKEAVIAVLDRWHCFGEGCLAGQPYRMATAASLAYCTIIIVDKAEMVRHVRSRPAFGAQFLTHNADEKHSHRGGSDDQLFNSSEKRLIESCRKYRRRRSRRWWGRRGRE